ncbi:MAG TPA: efflux RND transporter periplasmic adaptor subunit [Nitrosospira sp.]|nr:efflux RND transporter periplasmic adaptor subunit [Nitrosospira sp.]
MVKKKQQIAIVAVVAIGIVLGTVILTADRRTSPSGAEASGEAAHGHETTGKNASAYPVEETAIGPHGGRLLAADGLGVEITLYETGVPPQFRIYLHERGKPLPPTAAKVTVTLLRLGQPAQVYTFKPEADYLVGDHPVEEPHSFDVAVAAEWKGKRLHWKYAQAEMRVEIPDDMLKSMGIEILTAKPETIRTALKLPGEIVFNEHTIVQVVPRLPGIVTAVYRHHGQHVEKGDALAVIDSQMLAELRSQYLVAQKRLGLARTTFEREKRLWEEKITAKQDYLTAQELLTEAEIAVELAAVKLRSLGVRPETNGRGENLARFQILAPISGLITEKAIAQGQTLKEDDNIFTIADVSTVWAAVTVYPKDLAVIRVGQRVTIKATAFDISGEGPITYISTLIGGQTRTATARVELDNKDGRWRPGMFITAELVTGEIPVAVAVETSAVQTLGDWTVVFGRYGPYFEARPVELGRSDGKLVEVLRGLHARENYAAGNSFAIKAELGKAGASHQH